MQQNFLCRLSVAASFLAAALNLSAQGTAISYQGQLDSSGAPANANYDFRFAVYNAPTNGIMVSGWVTNSDVAVSNGLFSVMLNFGPGVFNGTDNGSNDWMDIAVRTTGPGSFTELYPRQPILPVPYALFATSASNLLGSLASTQILGAISSTLISGGYSNTVNFVSSGNTFNGTFTGNGAGLTSLNASQLTSGTVSDARLQSDVALLDQNQTFSGQNAFTASNSFSGLGYYSGVNNFVNSGNSFFGSFFGNGLVGWFPVVATATNASRDAGYLMLNAGFSSVTLPASASLSVDDIIRVAGGGTGGWTVKVNSGQSIIGNFAAYGNGSLKPIQGVTGGSVTANGYGVAASADGMRIYLVGGDVNDVVASSDGGQTWSQVIGSMPGTYYYSVACSANGKIVYAEPTSGTIEMSTNSGVTWTATGYTANSEAISCTANGGTLLMNGVACSGSGVYQVQVSGGKLYYSSNTGGSFAQITTAPASVACAGASSDCTRIVVGVNDGLLYASANLGATWTALTFTNQYWSSAWMSPDGSKIAATTSKNVSVNGGVFYCAVPTLPDTTTTSAITGSRDSAVELQYTGNGDFMPVGSTGLLWAN